MCRDGIPPKNCAAVIILALSSSGAKRKYVLTNAQGLLRNVTLQFHSRGWITIPGFPSKKKWNSTGWFCPPPALPLYRGRDVYCTLEDVLLFSLLFALAKVEKFGRIDILINNASALWWQRKQQSVTALCCFSGPN